MVASKAMVDTEATATMITLVDTTAVTVADMTTVSTDCSWGFFPAPPSGSCECEGLKYLSLLFSYPPRPGQYKLWKNSKTWGSPE